MQHDLVLENELVRLVPVADEHVPTLTTMIDKEMWLGMITQFPDGDDGMQRRINTLLAEPYQMAFTVFDANTGDIVGSTSFYDISHAQKRCEIGSTFYARKHWGTWVNPATKLAMLKHAFEQWGMNRVALRCDTRNVRSIAAIEKLGATKEGVMRAHRIASDGSRGDSVYYSIIIDDWAEVRRNLEARLRPE